ncbi:hypothetical protein IMZ16_04175 [Cruoricaptor ignavus]|uniref:Uncharacterized protein n=1 Tax=Cruoricaptor ignavus TaxID=1118202 RepID=A0A7M1T422_9FLAO|nr:hypothetical protein [Cruoricaptor ignavus]QOR74638.1 hypothetical protein IMZ16_04175 [Cruoricaptor ignavus]
MKIKKKLFINNVLLHLTVMKIQETFSIQQTTMKKRKLIVSHLKITKTATDCNGGCNVTGITVEGTPASAQDGDISFEALRKFGKTVNFARGTVQEFVCP